MHNSEFAVLLRLSLPMVNLTTIDDYAKDGGPGVV